MAIKERKQITGTTAQINAYEGHEGQIVWDKEKKTFVGMSGTAGTNYPLAQQAYVDDGLAGKEDKGVCLPLTGGVLSGHIELDPNYGSGNTDIGFNYEERLGSGIGFRSINHATEPGVFSIFARELTNSTSLVGKPDGTLTWDSKPLTYITSKGENPVSGRYIRYSDGIQICTHQTSSDLTTLVLSYPAPFKTLFATLIDNGTGAYSENWNSTSITIRSNTGPINYFSYFVIGTWK